MIEIKDFVGKNCGIPFMGNEGCVLVSNLGCDQPGTPDQPEEPSTLQEDMILQGMNLDAY